MVEFTPEALAHRSFRTTLRGFDQSEVREFLAQLSEALAELIAERDRLAATLQAGDAKDLQREIETVSNEIQAVLEAARGAAETMRERAAAETARWRSEAIAEAERTRRDAAADAEHLRTDAWTTSENLLTQVQREVSRLRDEAEKESMRLVGEAEREAHRTLGTARRESEEALRSARMEAEKLVLDARVSHDEIIETANRKAEVAQERTRALEERRDELRRELDAVRSAIAAVETELDERREALGLTASAPEPAAREQAEEWVPGETVRVVRPGQSEATNELPVVSEPRPRPDPTPELRVLSPDELRSRQRHPSTTGPVDTPDILQEDSLTTEDEPVVDEPHSPVPAEPEEDAPAGDVDGDSEGPREEPSATPPPVAEDAEIPSQPAAEETGGRRGALADVEGLFARLREPVDTRPPADPPDQPEPADAPVLNGAASPADMPMQPRSLEIDPFEVRDGLLLPISNRALRNVKRQLTEEQNAALERIRIDHTAWEPDQPALEASLRPDLVVLDAESFAAGHAAAEDLTSAKLTRPSTPPEAIAGAFVGALCADLERALADGRAHDHGAREMAADISRVFRAWRTDESERRIRHFSYVAYNRGLIASLPAGQNKAVRWVVAGRGCAVCRDLGGRVSIDQPPPAHEGCACTVVPA